MSERNTPCLHIVRASDQANESERVLDTGEDAATASEAIGAQEQEGVSLNAPLQQAIMHAAVSWVALVMERSVHPVS